MKTRYSWVALCVATLAVGHGLYTPIAAGTTSCHSSPAEINKPLDVTFTLPDDANQTKRNFTVYHYNDHMFQDTVLRCSWPGDRPYCSVATGYSFGWKIGRSFVLNIPTLSTAQIGFYACHLAGYDVTNIKPCRVALRQAADFQCSKEASTFFCQHRVQYSFESGVTRNFSLNMPSLSGDTVTEYFCSQSSSQQANKITIVAKQGTTCDIRPMPGMSETEELLTCNFLQDVYQENKDIAVYRYTETSFPEIVVSCAWVNNDLNCATKPGYSWNTSQVKDHLIVSVPGMSGAQKATYACKVHGYSAEYTKSCSGVTVWDKLKPQSVVSSGRDPAGGYQTSPTDKTSTKKIKVPVLKGIGSPPLNNGMVASDISAECSPSRVVLRQQAEVVCRFGEMIEAHNFVILHYSPNNTGVPDFPLMCFWMRGEVGCDASEGYEYEIIFVNHTVILRLPQVTSDHLGTYTCKSVTSHSGHGSCSLTLPVTYCDAECVGFLSESAAGSDESDDVVDRYTVFVSTAAAAVISAAVTVAACVFVMYKRGYRRYEHPQRRRDSDNDPYRKLPTRRYHKNKRTEEDTSYEEIRYSPPPQRIGKPDAAMSLRESAGSEVPEDVSSPVIIRDQASEQPNPEQMAWNHVSHAVQVSCGNQTCRQVSDITRRDPSDLPEVSLRHENVTSPRGNRNTNIQTLDTACVYLKKRMDSSSKDEDKQSKQNNVPVNVPLEASVASVDGDEEMNNDQPGRTLEQSEISSPSPSDILRTVGRISIYDQGNSPPDQGKFYLHPVHDLPYTSSQESLVQAPDLSHACLHVRDPKTSDVRDARRQGDALSEDYLQPLSVDCNTRAHPASSSRFSQSQGPENFPPEYENNVHHH